MSDWVPEVINLHKTRPNHLIEGLSAQSFSLQPFVALSKHMTLPKDVQQDP